MIHKLDLKRFDKLLIEKFGRNVIKSTYYDTCDLEDFADLYWVEDEFPDMRCGESSLELIIPKGEIIVTKYNQEYGKFTIKRYKRDKIKLIDFKEDFDFYSVFGDIIDVIISSSQKLYEEEYKEEIQIKSQIFSSL